MFAVENKSSDLEPKTRCPNCDSVYSNSIWLYRDCLLEDVESVQPVYANSSDDYAGTYYIVRNDTIESWECPYCPAHVLELTETSEENEERWLCGVCGSGYPTSEYANNCCSSLDNPQPDPAIFAQANMQ